MMVNSIFSMFDPSNKICNPFAIYIYMTYLLKSNIEKNFKKMKSYSNQMIITVFNQLNQNMENKSINMSKMNLYYLFLSIMIFNIMSLTPMSWAMTAQMSFNISVIVSSYFMILSMTKSKFVDFLTHLTPKSTPYAIIPFMILIELISWMARPITLILRLTANMTSGHILLLLIFKPTNSILFPFPLLMMIALIPMIILEFMVAVIQSYILMTLISLYMKDI